MQNRIVRFKETAGSLARRGSPLLALLLMACAQSGGKLLSSSPGVDPWKVSTKNLHPYKDLFTAYRQERKRALRELAQLHEHTADMRMRPSAKIGMMAFFADARSYIISCDQALRVSEAPDNRLIMVDQLAACHKTMMNVQRLILQRRLIMSLSA